ncbi:MAG: hypothetical protein ABJA37_14280, partial [Ferruginibacter sp.]
MRKIYFFLIATFLFVNLSTAQLVWIGGATGDYSLPANWNLGRVPGGADVIQFNAAFPIVVTNVPTQSIAGIEILTGTSSVSLAANAGNILTLTNANPIRYTSVGSILAADFLTISLSAATNLTINACTFGIASGTGGKVIINGTLLLSGGTLDFDVAGTGGATINGTVNYTSGLFASVNASSIT